MSSRTSRTDPRSAGPDPRQPDADQDQARDLGSPAVRLAVFAALAAFSAMHWAGLVIDPPVLRTALTVLVVTMGGAVLATVGRSRLGTFPAWTLAAAVVIATTMAALAVTGLPVRLLWISNWDELRALLDAGFAGISADGFDYPYAGENASSRLVILLGAPVLLGLAAAASFWPRRRMRLPSLLGVKSASPISRQALGLGGLAVLVVLYAIPATENPPSAPLLGGLALFVLVAGWLWLPGLRHREAGVAVALVALAAAFAVPLTTQLEDAEGFIDYKNWAWSSAGAGVTFDWEHSYGPIDWPRDERVVLRVGSEKPHYWKLSTLDRFDGRRWLTTPSPQEPLELPGEVERTTQFPLLQPPPEEWVSRVTFEIGELRSNLIVGSGVIRSIRGLGDKAPSEGNGGTWDLARPLEEGDAYQVQVYAPDPSEDQLRASEGRYPKILARATEIGLIGELAPPDSPECLAPGGCVEVPGTGESGGSTELRAIDNAVVPLHGRRAGPKRAARVDARLRASNYARMYDLAQELTAGESTSFDAAKAVETHLRENYTYSELPPDTTYPLSDFLFEDRIGYCQQFSGAMALMLRMVGIPTRVVTGFAPGQRDPDNGTYVVRNLDAHSWVEVYFNGIGWVTFDPTPAASPAQSQLSDDGSAADDVSQQSSAGLGEGGSATGDGAGQGATSADAGGNGFSSVLIAPIAVLVLALGGLGLIATRAFSARRLSADATTRAQLRELETALPRLGWALRPGATLLGLERTLGAAAGAVGSRYLAKLRARRYSAVSAAAPTAAERRALRRGLTSGRGPGARLRGYIALPPWGPRP